VPHALRDLLIDHGWAEEHLIAKAGLISDTILFVYAPRNESELNVVMWIVRNSLDFARGVRMGASAL
jgi:hypothetical protein